MNRESVEGGKISLPGLPEQVQRALLWLQNHSWRFGFVVDSQEEDLPETDEDKVEEGNDLPDEEPDQED